MVRTVGVEPTNPCHEMAVLETAVFAIPPHPHTNESGGAEMLPRRAFGVGGPRIRI